MFGFEWHDATYCPEARHHNLHSALRLLHHQRRRLLRDIAPLQVTPDDLENVAVLLGSRITSSPGWAGTPARSQRRGRCAFVGASSYPT